MIEKDMAIGLIVTGIFCLVLAISLCFGKMAKKVDDKYGIPDYEEGEYYDKRKRK